MQDAKPSESNGSPSRIASEYPPPQLGAPKRGLVILVARPPRTRILYRYPLVLLRPDLTRSRLPKHRRCSCQAARCRRHQSPTQQRLALWYLFRQHPRRLLRLGPLHRALRVRPQNRVFPGSATIREPKTSIPLPMRMSVPSSGEVYADNVSWLGQTLELPVAPADSTERNDVGEGLPYVAPFGAVC